RTGAEHALDRQVAAEQVRQPTAHRQAEAGPTALAGWRLVDLLERLEDRRDAVRLDPDPRVPHDDHDLLRGLGSRGDLDLARIRELDRVRQEVQQDLADLARIGVDPERRGRDPDADPEG